MILEFFKLILERKYISPKTVEYALQVQIDKDRVLEDLTQTRRMFSTFLNSHAKKNKHTIRRRTKSFLEIRVGPTQTRVAIVRIINTTLSLLNSDIESRLAYTVQ